MSEAAASQDILVPWLAIYAGLSAQAAHSDIAHRVTVKLAFLGYSCWSTLPAFNRGPMRQLFLLAFLFLGWFASPLPAQQHRAYTTARLHLRAEPSANARVLSTIPRGEEVRRGVCSDGWCAVVHEARTGYVAERYLSTAAPTPSTAPQGRGYTNSDGVRVASPRRTADGKPPAGASAQCRDGTYSFSLHRRGTCSHHGGVSRWLP
jgi:uncharacterized protein YraI